MRALRAGALSVRLDPRAVIVCTALAGAVMVVGGVALSTGAFYVSISDVVRTILGHGDPVQVFIVETLRLPRLLTGLLVGAALGVGGALFQSLARNPLASPDIVGFDAGAATGALLVILVWHGPMGQVAVGAVAGGAVTALVVLVLASKRGVAGHRLILVGIGVAAMLTATNSYLLTRAQLIDAQAAAVWLTGSLNGRGWEHVRPVALAVGVLVPLAAWLGRDLRMLELGDDAGRALGVSAPPVRLMAVVVGVGLTATATASAGPIVFVALAAPQVARRLTRAPGPNVAASALTGALVLVASDLAAQRLFDPVVLPVGVMTGVVGGLYLVWLLGMQWRKGRG